MMMTSYGTRVLDGRKVSTDSRLLMKELAANVVYSPPKKVSKPRQMKLKQYLNREKMNWQKYPLRNCVWSDSLGKHAYEPPKYKKIIGELELSQAKCCDQCFLRPCVVEVTTVSMKQDLKAVWEYPPLAMKRAMCTTMDFMDKTCGVTFMKRMGIGRERVPRCVRSVMLDMMNLTVLEMNGQLRGMREDLDGESPDYLLEASNEYHLKSLHLALEEMRGKLTTDEVYRLVEKYELHAKNKMQGVLQKHKMYMEGKQSREPTNYKE